MAQEELKATIYQLAKVAFELAKLIDERTDNIILTCHKTENSEGFDLVAFDWKVGDDEDSRLFGINQYDYHNEEVVA